MKPVSPVVPAENLLEETIFTGIGCENLPAWVDPEDGKVLMRWEVTDADLERIKEHRSVWIWVFGHGRIFPMSVTTDKPITLPEDQARQVKRDLEVEGATAKLTDILSTMGSQIEEITHGAFETEGQQYPLTMDMMAQRFGYNVCLAVVLNAATIGGYHSNIISAQSVIDRKAGVKKYLDDCDDDKIKVAVRASMEFVEYCEALATAEASEMEQ